MLKVKGNHYTIFRGAICSFILHDALEKQDLIIDVYCHKPVYIMCIQWATVGALEGSIRWHFTTLCYSPMKLNVYIPIDKKPLTFRNNSHRTTVKCRRAWLFELKQENCFLYIQWKLKKLLLSGSNMSSYFKWLSFRNKSNGLKRHNFVTVGKWQRDESMAD